MKLTVAILLSLLLTGAAAAGGIPPLHLGFGISNGGMVGALTVVAPGAQTATVGTAYSLNMTATGGSGGNQWTLVNATPNANLWLSVQTNSNGTGQLDGNPGTLETETVTVQVEDSAGDTAQATFSITVGD